MKKFILFFSLVFAQLAIANPTIVNYDSSHRDQVFKILYEEPFLIFPGEELIKSGQMTMDFFYERTQELFNANLKSSYWANKVLLVDNEVCGFASYMHHQNETYLGCLAITKKCRGQGLGTVFMNNVIEDAKKANSKNIKLEVNQSNSRAQNFYKKNGFNIAKYPVNSFIQECNQVCYKKDLTLLGKLQNKLVSWKKPFAIGASIFAGSAIAYFGYTYFAEHANSE